MKTIIVPGKPSDLLFSCPFCGCEFLCSHDDYAIEENGISSSNGELFFNYAVHTTCPNCGAHAVKGDDFWDEGEDDG